MTQERTQSIIDFCRKMIQAKSYSGGENEVVEIMKAFAGEHNFDEVIVDRYGNCILKIKGERKGPTVLFDGHMDTVPVIDPSDWSHDPFEAEICDGKIYGRGTSDMKGALSAMLSAAAMFFEDNGRDFAGEIAVAGVVHEECFEGVAAREISKNVRPDIVVIGESTNLNLKIGQRGRAEIVVETFGVPAHSANPEKGINAVYKMSRVIEELQKLVPPYQEGLGPGIMELTDIKSAPYPGASVVPAYCSATYDRRLLVGETKESVLAPIQKILDEMMKEDPQLKAKVSYAYGEEKCFTGETIGSERFFPGWLYEENEDYIQAVYKELKDRGYEPGITNYNFCTNGSHYAGEAGIKTFGIGPSVESLAHTIDEYIEIDQLVKACDCYYGVMNALMK